MSSSTPLKTTEGIPSIPPISTDANYYKKGATERKSCQQSGLYATMAENAWNKIRGDVIATKSSFSIPRPSFSLPKSSASVEAAGIDDDSDLPDLIPLFSDDESFSEPSSPDMKAFPSDSGVLSNLSNLFGFGSSSKASEPEPTTMSAFGSPSPSWKERLGFGKDVPDDEDRDTFTGFGDDSSDGFFSFLKPRSRDDSEFTGFSGGGRRRKSVRRRKRTRKTRKMSRKIKRRNQFSNRRKR